MKIFLSYIVLSVLLISCGGAKKGDSSNVANSSSALSCSIQEKPDIPATCTIQADVYRQEQNQQLAKDIAYASLHGININEASRRLAISNGAKQVELTCYQNAGSPTKKEQVCTSGAVDSLPIITRTKSAISCLSGRNRLIQNANFFLRTTSAATALTGDWQQGTINEGLVEEVYVGVSAFRDLMFLSKMSKDGSVIGYNMTLSYCEVPAAYANYPALVSNNRVLTNFQAPNGIYISTAKPCGYGLIASAQNTKIISEKNSSDPYTSDYPIFTSFAAPSCI